tara:strand:- start:1056 stop:1262 length:207 start_codon:yes stop_codon:yes gene_type:complete
MGQTSKTKTTITFLNFMRNNRNRHKSKKTNQTKEKTSKGANTLGDIFKSQGINLNELKEKLNGKEKAN